jgi:hypothetical protein
MASPGPTSPPLPTREQCFSLSEAQCHKILLHRDPNNTRANKNWELVHQPELVRLYMTMISFPQIRDSMKQNLDYWSVVSVTLMDDFLIQSIVIKHMQTGTKTGIFQSIDASESKPSGTYLRWYQIQVIINPPRQRP